jgi:hypothetical protein
VKRYFSDPLLSCFPRLYILDPHGESFRYQREEDPMLLEHACVLLPSACSAQPPTNSPPYVPVSHDWQPVAEGAEGAV